MIKLVWRHRHSVARSETPTGSADVSAVSSVATSNVNLTERAVVEKERANTSATSKPNAAWRWHWRSTLKTDAPRSSDPEKEGAEEKEPRPVRLYAPFYCGLAVALSICRAFARRSSSLAHFFFFIFSVFVGSGVAVLLAEWALDNGYARFSLVVTTPFLFSVALVGHSIPHLGGRPAEPRLVLLPSTGWKSCLGVRRPWYPSSSLAKIILSIGPVSQYHENSKYYSAVRPKPDREVDDALPHITIELPVFKESLTETMYVSRRMPHPPDLILSLSL